MDNLDRKPVELGTEMMSTAIHAVLEEIGRFKTGLPFLLDQLAQDRDQELLLLGMTPALSANYARPLATLYAITPRRLRP